MVVETRNIFWGDYQLFDTNILSIDAGPRPCFLRVFLAYPPFSGVSAVFWRILASAVISKKFREMRIRQINTPDRKAEASSYGDRVYLWVLSPKPADYTVVEYKDEREDDLYML